MEREYRYILQLQPWCEGLYTRGAHRKYSSDCQKKVGLFRVFSIQERIDQEPNKAPLFVGNCVSSFTAFVVKQRYVNNLKTLFWGVDPAPKDEL